MVLTLVPACDSNGGGEDPNEVVVARSEFIDSEAVTWRQDDESLRTELFDADGDVVALALHRNGGEGSLSIGGSEPQPFASSQGVSLTDLHGSIHDVWSSLRDSPSLQDGISAATTCFVGENPKIQVSCGLSCDFPEPYDMYGRAAYANYYYSREQCESYMNSCGDKELVLYHYLYYPDWGVARTFCYWQDA